VAAGAAGFMTGSDKTKLDGVASGATANTLAVSTTTPTAIGTAAAVGVGTTAARADHAHALTAATAGQTWVFWNSVWYQIGVFTGTDLTDADQTLQVGNGCQYFLPPSVLTTTRAKTIGTTGATAGIVVTIISLGYSGTAAQICNVVNGGAGAGTIFSFPASPSNPIEATYRFDGTNWVLASWRYLSTPVAR
jgi:hypothetical protein